MVAFEMAIARCTVCMPVCKGRKFVVDVLAVLYGLGSWIAMTGLWVELPLLVQRLPESWTLAASLTLTLQIANIGPVVYGLLNQWYPKLVNEISGSHIQLLIGTVSTLVLIFTWSSTVHVGESEISLPLYVLAFGLSLVDCTSSVVFLPYMARFRSVYLIPYLVGEGLSGLLPSLVASAQGIGETICIHVNNSRNETDVVPWIGEASFEPEWFFAFLCFMVLLSWIAFFLLEKLDVCRKEELVVPKKETNNFQMVVLEGSVKFKADVVIQATPRVDYLFYYMIGVQGWASLATFGIFPPIQTYSCLPYGYKPFHLAVVLSGVSYPLACLVALFYAPMNTVHVTVLNFSATIVAAFILYTAIMSPNLPMVNSIAGSAFIVICWVLFTGMFSYVKTLATIFLSNNYGHRGLFWCGVVTQAGAAIGALVMYLLVNVFHFFEDGKEC